MTHIAKTRTSYVIINEDPIIAVNEYGRQIAGSAPDDITLGFATQDIHSFK
jgi:hypothetical protein